MLALTVVVTDAPVGVASFVDEAIRAGVNRKFESAHLEFWICLPPLVNSGRARRILASDAAALAAAQPPCLLDGLSDDLVLRLFSRAPFMAHGTLHVVCRRLKTLLRSRAFLTQRVDSGLAEHSLIVAGGVHTANSTASAECFAFCGRWWRPIAPLSTPRFGPCSAMMENEDGLPEMWVLAALMVCLWPRRGLQPAHEHMALVPAAEPAPY